MDKRTSVPNITLSKAFKLASQVREAYLECEHLNVSGHTEQAASLALKKLLDLSVLAGPVELELMDDLLKHKST